MRRSERVGRRKDEEVFLSYQHETKAYREQSHSAQRSRASLSSRSSVPSTTFFLSPSPPFSSPHTLHSFPSLLHASGLEEMFHSVKGQAGGKAERFGGQIRR